jgi:hypothetical protein
VELAFQNKNALSRLAAISEIFCRDDDSQFLFTLVAAILDLDPM